jgi:hypothetical protein
MKGLSLEGGSSLLLAAAWATSEGRICCEMFPEVMVFVMACGTNAKKRPMARGTLTTSNGKNVPTLLSCHQSVDGCLTGFS